jgi:hypothetical protein
MASANRGPCAAKSQGVPALRYRFGGDGVGGVKHLAGLWLSMVPTQIGPNKGTPLVCFGCDREVE